MYHLPVDNYKNLNKNPMHIPIDTIIYICYHEYIKASIKHKPNKRKIYMRLVVLLNTENKITALTFLELVILAGQYTIPFSKYYIIQG